MPAKFLPLIFLVCFAAIALQAHAQEKVKAADEPHALRPEFNELKSVVYRRTCLSVARVTRMTPLGAETHTGFFVGEGGKMITVLSSIDGAALKIGYGVDSRRELAGKLLASDPYTGLALLQVEGARDVPVLVPGSSTGLKPGDYVYGVGETADIAKACAVGRVAGRDRGLDGKILATSVMRLNMPATEGLSGAPVMDRDAKLVGVLLLAEDEKGAGPSYALPIELVSKLLADHARHGEMQAPWLGFGMHLGSTTPEVRSLQPGSPAERAGLEIGDVILSIGERKIEDYQQVIDACYALTVGVPVEFRVLRGLDDRAVKVVPALRRATQSKEEEAGE